MQHGHLARPHLVDDLTGLLVPLLIDLGALEVRQRAQRAGRDAGGEGSTESAVRMLSRPKSVANHGMPAMM